MRSASRSSASISACAASSSSENGDTTAGLGAALCSSPVTAGLTTTLRLPPRDGADLKPEASSTADIDISDRARMIWSAERPKECLFCFFFISGWYALCSSAVGNCHRLKHNVIHRRVLPRCLAPFAVVLGFVQKSQGRTQLVVGASNMCNTFLQFFENFFEKDCGPVFSKN